ncbi:MAG TPA: proline dehydrogenase family protein [Gaiellaceae bacterium]|jgi:proline dehydrogenase|nr:proline dehydrogenase family protein [Gaiellaceae bacterium]
MSLFDRAIVRTLPAVPRPVVRRLSARYIAGPELRDAVRVVRELNAEGKMATLDVLGEEVTGRNEALALVDEYLAVFEAIRREGLDSNVSVKPTGLGLAIDADFFHDNLAQLVRCAEERSSFVRIDMEDSSTTSETLAVYRRLRAEGHESVGVVLQSRLRRTLGDVAELADLRPNVRVCKGIYLEPVDIAYQGAEAIREHFVDVLEALLEAGAYVGVATHDQWVIDRAKELVEAHGLSRDEYEFQMLLGVGERLGEALVADGHRLRIYVPYGRQWYEYSLRRLQENPSMAGAIARQTVGRLVPGLNGS